MRHAIKWVLLASALLAFAPRGESQCLPAVCALTLTLQSDASGISLGGSGSSSTTISFGTLGAFTGSLPSGVTRSRTSTTWTLSTPFDVNVTCTNLLNLLPCTLIVTPTFTLTAQLQTSDLTDTWSVGGLTLSSASASTLTSAGTYGAVTPYTLALTIPFTKSTGAISNTINFVAISN
jgi:hypothetical protein